MKCNFCLYFSTAMNINIDIKLFHLIITIIRINDQVNLIIQIELTDKDKHRSSLFTSH